MVNLQSEHDVTIVGAGITGLTTALLSLRAGLSVAVVDSGLQLGSRAGLMPSASRAQNTIYSRIHQWWGVDGVQSYADQLARGQELLEALATELEVPFERGANAVSTCDGADAFWLRRESPIMRGAGLSIDFNDDLHVPFDLRPSIVMANQTQLDPVDYRDALAQAVVSHGGELHSSFVPGRQMISTTTLPMVDRAGMRARLSPAKWQWIALRGASSPDADIELVDDGGRQLVRRRDEQGRDELWVGSRSDSGEAFVAKHYPEAEPIAHWQAETASTFDGLPFVGHAGPKKTDLVACGFDSWELVSGTIAARQLLDVLTGATDTFPWSPLRVPSAGAMGQALSRGMRYAMRLSVVPPFPTQLRQQRD